MKTIKKFLSRVVDFFAGLATPEGQKKLNEALSKAYDLLGQALPIVEMLAKLTPTRADDEIVALIKTYAIPLSVPDHPMTESDKAYFLRQSAVTLLKRELKDHTSVPDNVIDLGVQLAYSAFKATSRA